MTIRGTVGRSDLEGGYFTFTDGNETWKLEGGGADLLAEGVRAEIDGEVRGDMMGIGFGAPVFQVRRYRVISAKS